MPGQVDKPTRLMVAIAIGILARGTLAIADDLAELPGKLYALETDELSSFSQLARMNPDGSGLEDIPTAKKFCLYPALSPDGSQLAYTAFDRNQGRGPTYVKLYLANADGTNAVRLADSVFHVSWSSDGNHLLASRMIFRDGKQVGAQIELLDLDGSVVKELGPGFCAAWSPVGNRIACVTAVEESQHGLLTLMNVDGLGRELIDKSAEGQPLHISPYCCAWSPDARQIAIVQRVKVGENKVSFLATLDVTSREVKHVARLSTDEGDLLTATWSPDGKWLAYAVERDQVSRIFVAPVAGGTARCISPADRNLFMPVWSR